MILILLFLNAFTHMLARYCSSAGFKGGDTRGQEPGAPMNKNALFFLKND